MTMTKILVTGSGGQLGSELQVLAEDFPAFEFEFTDYPELDLTKTSHLEQAFENHDFDYCINCAAYTAVDQAEKDKKLADALNAHACETLAKLCKANNTTLIHISTDFVFSGEAFRPLQENFITNPVNYYGLSKRRGEKVIQNRMQQFLIFRTSWLYSSFGSNFVKTMIRLSASKDELHIISDQVGTPTYAHDLARAILDVISTKSEAYGIYHYSNEGVASWYDFTKAIFEYQQITTKVLPIPTEKYPTPASRPHYSVMDKSKFKNTFGLEIPYWRESLKKCLQKL